MNIPALKQYLNCDNDFLESIINKFIEESRKITADIKEAAKAGNWKQVGLSAHKMLSSVKIFEITDLISLLEKLEKESAIESKHAELKTAIEDLSILNEKAIAEMQAAFTELD